MRARPGFRHHMQLTFESENASDAILGRLYQEKWIFFWLLERQPAAVSLSA